MSNTTVLISQNETFDTFLSMKDGLGLLLPQLQRLFQSFEVLPSFGSLADEMITSFSIYERQIAELSHQLHSKLQEYADLRTSIDQSCHCSPTTEDLEVIDEMIPIFPPISRCPDIILDSIFELVAEEGSHNILPMLTVSKRFHRLAMLNPLLWTKIFIYIDYDMTERNYLSARYINACLERSGDTSLDVILDYTRFPEPYQFMRTYIYNLVRCSTEDKQVKQDILSHLDGEFYDDDRVSSWDYPFYDRKLKPLLDIVRSLVGPEGIHVRRWKSAVISLGGTDSVDEAMWGIINVEMPNLVSLHISQFDHSIWDRPSLWPALRELTTSAMIAIRHVPIDFNALTSFEFRHFNYQKYSSNFATLSQCVALRKLTIKCDGLPIDNTPQIEVELPMLISLTLEGKVDLIDYVRFISPKLEDWILDCEPCNKFPDVDAVFVEWYCRKVWRGNTPGAERSCLLQVLSTFKRTTSFTAVELEHAELCFDTICALAEAKTLPACLGLIEIDGAGSLNLAGSR